MKNKPRPSLRAPTFDLGKRSSGGSDRNRIADAASLSPVLFAMVALGGVTAFVRAAEPVYSYASAAVSEGLAMPESNDQHGVGSVSAEAGDYCWFHACPGLPSASFGAVAAWGQASADAATGSATLEADVFNYGVPAAPHPWPPYDHWGVSNTYAYLRTTWAVTSTDPSLAWGDPVELSLSLHLDGVFDLHSVTNPDRGRSSAQVMFMLNHAADTFWLEEDSIFDESRYLNRGAFADILGTYADEMLEFGGNGISNVDGPVSLDTTRTITAQVGDVLTLEVGVTNDLWLRNTNAAGYSDIIYIEGDFAHTFAQSFEAMTPGANLTLVPEPGMLAFLFGSLSGLAVLGQRRRRQTRSP